MFRSHNGHFDRVSIHCRSACCYHSFFSGSSTNFGHCGPIYHWKIELYDDRRSAMNVRVCDFAIFFFQVISHFDCYTFVRSDTLNTRIIFIRAISCSFPSFSSLLLFFFFVRLVSLLNVFHKRFVVAAVAVVVVLPSKIRLCISLNSSMSATVLHSCACETSETHVSKRRPF